MPRFLAAHPAPACPAAALPPDSERIVLLRADQLPGGVKSNDVHDIADTLKLGTYVDLTRSCTLPMHAQSKTKLPHSNAVWVAVG